jgi:signal peptidase I
MIKRSKKRWLKKYDGKKYDWFLMARDTVLIFIAVAICFSLLIGASKVSGQSMLPTLQNGQMVFFLRFAPNLKRGDVVFVRMPSGAYFVKRVIAVEGDVVELEHDILYVNGQADPHSLTSKTMEQPGIVQYPYTVPAGTVFLVGDNRPASEDSRSFGAIPTSSIKGKLFID